MRLKDKTAVATGGARGIGSPPPSQRRRAKGTGTTYVYQRLREVFDGVLMATGARLDAGRLLV